MRAARRSRGSFRGPRQARRIVWSGFALAVLLSIWLATPRIAIASGTAFLAGQKLTLNSVAGQGIGIDFDLGAVWTEAPRTFVLAPVSLELGGLLKLSARVSIANVPRGAFSPNLAQATAMAAQVEADATELDRLQQFLDLIDRGHGSGHFDRLDNYSSRHTFFIALHSRSHRGRHVPQDLERRRKTVKRKGRRSSPSKGGGLRSPRPPRAM
jgi:hypothetical protein